MGPSLIIAYSSICSRPISVTENVPRDEEIHLDLAILMVKALFDARVQGTHNSSLKGNWAHSSPSSRGQEAFLPDLVPAVFTG